MKGCFGYRKFVSALAVGTVLFAADRLLKKIAVSCPDPHCGRIFFNFRENYSLAFGIPFGPLLSTILPALIMAVLSVLIVGAYKKKDGLLCLALFSIILGSASNLMDRLFYGFVVDYIDVPLFTVFNLADVLIVFGIGLWALRLFGRKE